jgi:PKD repeat protein
VTVYPTPSISVANAETCDGSAATLTADTTGSDCPVVSYQWYAVDGNIETPVGGNSDTHTLPADLDPGVYTYACVVVCESGCSARDEATITVFAPCDALAPDFGVCEGVSLSDDLFVTNGAGCGDPNCCSVTFDYSAVNTSTPGQYQYTVTCGCPDGPCAPVQASGTVTVNAEPTASFTVSPSSGTRTLNVQFTDNSTTPAGSTIVLWEWNLDNDPTIERTDTSAPAPFQQSLATAGTYLVSLTVTTEEGCSDTTTRTITVTNPSTPSGGGGGVDLAGEPTCFFDVDMLGEVTRIYVTCQDGRCIGNYEPDDPSDENYLEFTGGTRVTYNIDGEFNGGPPRWVRMREMDSPPPTSEGQVAVTAVYSFIGYTATGLPTDSIFFDAAVGMQLDYNPDALPENTTGVGIAGWNEETHQWEFLPQATGRVAGVGTATADVMHFSTFAVLATTGEAVSEAPAAVITPAVPAGSRPATFAGSNLQIEPAVERLWGPLTFITRTGNSVTITAIVENVGNESGIYVAELMLNGKVVGSQDVSLAGGEQKQVRFVVSRIAAGDYRVQIGELSGAFTSEREVTWWLIAVVIALAAGLAGWFALHQRRKKQIA